ncbi:MAG: oligosaccharide flippase family protein [Candidatus Eisenbacteria sp.]|nr:oligosaccharide flippase family protein [Candidatus Eisenbacteria bacterium]
MAKLTTQAGGVSLGRGIAAVAGLATVMVLSRLLSQEDYGTYRQVWLIFFVLAPVMELGLTQSASFFGAQMQRPDRKTYLAQNSLTLLLSGILTSAALFSFAAPISNLFGNPGLIVLLRAFALFPAFTLPFNMAENTLVAVGRAGSAGLVTAIAALLQTAVTLVAFFAGASLTQVFFYLTLWAFLRWIATTAAFIYIYRDLTIRWDWPQLRGQLGFALPMGAAMMVGLLGRQMDKLIVSSYFSTERFAVYSNGSYDIPLINIVTLSVTAVLVPAIVRARVAGDVAEVQRIWHGAARRVATLFYPVFAFLLVAARPFMIVLFSEDYAESAEPFRVFLFLFPIRIAFHSGLLRALGRTKQILVASAGSFAISLVAALLLVRLPGIGFLGPAIASVLGAYFAAIYAIVDASRVLGWRRREYFPWRKLATIMAVSLIAALPTLLAGWFLRAEAAATQLIVMAVVYGGVYLLLGETTGVARTREWWQVVNDVARQR